jgi:hypothetical protein
MWIPKAIQLYQMTHARAAATGASNSFVVESYDGTSLLSSFSFANADGTSKSAAHTGTAAAAGGFSAGEAFLQRHVLTGSASADGAFAFVYQDTTNNRMSYYCVGGGHQNLGVAGTPGEFIAIQGEGTNGTTTETSAQTVWPRAGTVKNVAIAYNTGADNPYRLHFQKNAVSAGYIEMAASAAAALIIDTTTTFTVAAGDLICWNPIRQSGTSNTLVMTVCFGFEAL